MSVIKIENLWKEYRLGVISHGTMTHDLQSWWARVRGKVDPNKKIAPIAQVDQAKQVNGNKFLALRDINLEIQQGDVLGIIGRNGAGKSTLLKILSRVTAPTRGSIKVKGRIASLLEVGTGFHPELTGYENIFLNGAILGMSKGEIKSTLEEIIDFSGVEEFIDTPVKRYSSGMYVRLAFAVAAHLEPEILVVDEVLAVGDIEFQKKCLGKMGEVSRAGRTILFVSHNMGAIKSLTDRCLYLSSGEVVLVDETREVVNSYLLSSEKDSSVDVGENLRSRQSLGQKVRIVRINPISKNGHVFLFGEELTFLITVRSFVKKDNLRFALSIYDLLGNGIVASFTHEDLLVEKDIDQKFKIRIKNLCLAPGHYRIGLSVGIGSLQKWDYSFDSVPQGPVFEVAQFGKNEISVARWESSWGNIYHDEISVDPMGDSF